MRKCVITGASGLIGLHAISQLQSAWEVHAISRQPPILNSGESIVWHQTDLCDQFSRANLPHEVDAIIYLAQSEYFRDFPAHAVDVFEVNTFQVLNMLGYAREVGARTFVFASSGGVYGSGDQHMSEEADIPAKGNLGFYLSTKLCSEIVCQNYTPYLNVIILRFFFVYGPGQRRSMLIPRLIDNVRNSRPIALQGENGIRLNPTHVSDAVSAISCALDLKGSYTINVGGPGVLSLREIGNIIGKVLDITPIFTVETGTAPKHIIGDISKMTDLLMAPKVRFEEGVKTVL